MRLVNLCVYQGTLLGLSDSGEIYVIETPLGPGEPRFERIYPKIAPRRDAPLPTFTKSKGRP